MVPCSTYPAHKPPAVGAETGTEDAGGDPGSVYPGLSDSVSIKPTSTATRSGITQNFLQEFTGTSAGHCEEPAEGRVGWRGAGHPSNTTAPWAAAALCFEPNTKKARRVEKTQLGGGETATCRSVASGRQAASAKVEATKVLQVKTAPVTLCPRQHTAYCHEDWHPILIGGFVDASRGAWPRRAEPRPAPPRPSGQGAAAQGHFLSSLALGGEGGIPGGAPRLRAPLHTC